MIENFIRKYLYLIILILVAIIHYKVFFNPFTYTFNFADNHGYAKLIELTRISFEIGTPFYIPKDFIFWGENYKIFLITPLWQLLGALVSYVIPSLVFINIVILGSLYLNILCSYKLFEYINKGNPILSFTGAVTFGASSLVLYATWFNLMGLFFIPLCILFFLKYIDLGNKKYAVYSTLSFILLGLSSTYFLPLIGIILLPFLIAFFKGNIKKISIILLLFVVSFIGIFSVYKIPFQYLDSYNKGVVVEDLLEKRRISSSLDLLELFTPNRENFLSKFQLDVVKSLSTSDNKFFRYSNYIPLPVVLLLFLSLFGYSAYRSGENTYKKYKYVSIFIIIISTILFLGDRFTIGRIDLGFNNLLYYLKQLPNGEIIRKSAYFFFSLTFGISLLIISSFGKEFTEKNKILFIMCIPVILFSSIGPYYGNNFQIHQKQNIIGDIPANSLVLALPNSGYNNWEFQYNILQSNPNLKIIEVGNATLPDYTREVSNGTVYINELAYNSEIISESCDLGSKLDYILLYKKYTENFFFYSNKSGIFNNAKKKIEKCINIEKVKENSEIVIYKNLDAK